MDFSTEICKAAERIALQKIVKGNCLWVKDADIRDFVISHIGRAGVRQIYQYAAIKFGSAAPSKSAIGRFLKNVNDEIKMNGGVT